jgi:hypothetical protein
MADPTVDLAHLLRLEIDPAELYKRSRTVIDPKFGINIVDLGLVHGSSSAAACSVLGQTIGRCIGASWPSAALWQEPLDGPSKHAEGM